MLAMQLWTAITPYFSCNAGSKSSLRSREGGTQPTTVGGCKGATASDSVGAEEHS
jgi:hypothetical protein